MAGVDGRDPLDDFRTLQNELELYKKGFSKRKFVIVANKMDLPESAENLKKLKAKLRGKKIIPLSASTDGDFSELLKVLREKPGAEAPRSEASCQSDGNLFPMFFFSPRASPRV
jgi:GTP-binding protein